MKKETSCTLTECCMKTIFTTSKNKLMTQRGKKPKARNKTKTIFPVLTC